MRVVARPALDLHFCAKATVVSTNQKELSGANLYNTAPEKRHRTSSFFPFVDQVPYLSTRFRLPRKHAGITKWQKLASPWSWKIAKAWWVSIWGPCNTQCKFWDIHCPLEFFRFFGGYHCIWRYGEAQGAEEVQKNTFGKYSTEGIPR